MIHSYQSTKLGVNLLGGFWRKTYFTDGRRRPGNDISSAATV